MMSKNASSGAEQSSKSKSSWKDKMTEQQLDRKRAADRQQVRESRKRSRQTIAMLEEQVKLLSNQQHNTLVADLMHKNESLTEERDALFRRLQAICGAFGLNREDTHNLVTKSCLEQPRASSKNTPDTPVCESAELPISPPETSIHDATNDSPHQLESPPAGEQGDVAMSDDDLVTELDARMRVADSPSPFPEMYALMDQAACSLAVTDENFCEAVMMWRQSNPRINSVYDLAVRLYHINHKPSLMSREVLRRYAGIPTALGRIVHALSPPNQDLESLELLFENNDEVSSDAVSSYSAIDIAKREIAICAFESIRPWKYCSIMARMTMFWVLYRTLMVSSTYPIVGKRSPF